MNESLILVADWIAGLLFGAIFFGGLWWTIRNGLTSQQPVLWFFGSLVLRMSIALTGFYFVSSGHWERLLLCLIGFVMARVAVIWLTRSPENLHNCLEQEIRHAS